MAKSKYPGNFDTSVELPTTRDSINSDPINSLRSAVIQIERTLGINPQGSVGNTVASRLEKTLDSSGNILPSALAQAGVISGPITNNEVSEVAAIQESKLFLNFPTQLLQDEISMIQSDLDSFNDLLNEFSTKLSYHLNTSSLNRHPATAISTVTSSKFISDTATQNLSSSNVQLVLNDLYNSHINYSGLDISILNNSHSAKQIYFDNSNSNINASNVQNAIDLTAALFDGENITHQNFMHSNGRLRSGALRTPADIRVSQILFSDIPISFSSSNGNSEGTTLLTLLEVTPIGSYTVKPFDIIIIEDPADTAENYVGIYEIRKVNIISGNIISIEIYGLLKGSSTVSSTIIIGKNTEEVTNYASLLVSVLEEPTLTSSRLVQVSNPDSNCAISNGLRPFEITSSNRYFIVIIDGQNYTIDVYNPTISKQTIESIISKINESLVTNGAHALAYRLDYETGGSEITIVHNIPDDNLETHSIVISRGTDDAIDSLGFGYIEDKINLTVYGTKYYINGVNYSGLKSKLDSQQLTFFSGSNLINISNSNINFLNLGIRIGDIAIVTGASNSADNGSFYINSVSANDIGINNQQKPSGFIDDAGTNLRVRIFSSGLSVENITFDSVGSSFGSSLLEIFMDKNRDIYYNKVLEYEAVISGSESLIDVVDIDGKKVQTGVVTIYADEDPADPNAFLLSVNNTEHTSVNGRHKFIWLTDHNSNVRIKVYIPDAQAVASKIILDASSFSMQVYTFQNINSDSNILLSKVLYHNYNGRMAGGVFGPRFRSKLPNGTLGIKDLSSEVYEDHVDRPISELRFNGVIYGFEIENVTIDVNNFYNLDIRRGVAYVSGKRISKDTVTSIVTDIDSLSIDKFYIIIDEDGNFQVDSALGYKCTSPYAETDFCILGSVEYDGVNIDNFDLRLFIDHLDLKLLNSITVSPQPGMGHFTDPIKALKYAKRFNEQFPLAGTPVVHMKSGTYQISLDYSYNVASTVWDPNNITYQQIFYDKQIENGFFIDFPVVIEGEGSTTIVELINNSTFTDTTYQLTMPIIISGPAFGATTRSVSNLGSGDYIEIKNINLKNTRISCLDFNVDELGVEQQYNVKLNNVYFSFYNFPGIFIDGTNGPRAVELLEISDTTVNKGNLTIDNCTFISSGIYTSSVVRTKNISITNNIYIDPDNVTNFLFNDLYSFSTATSGANINIVNNRYNSSFNPNDGTGPEIVAGDTLRWGERFSRDIRVGNNGYFEDSAEVVNNYNYRAVKTKYITYYADDLYWLPVSLATAANNWSNSLSSVTFGTSVSSVSGITVVYPHIIIASTGGRFKVNPVKGGELTGLQIGYRNVSSGTTVTVRIYELNRFGGNTSLVIPPMTLLGTNSWTQGAAVPTYHIDSQILNYSISLNSYNHYIIDITHDDIVDSLHLNWIRLELEVPNVEEGIGFE